MGEYYRIYFIGDTGHVDGPAKIILAENDKEAVERAREFVDGQDAEVWLQARCVAVLKRK